MPHSFCQKKDPAMHRLLSGYTGGGGGILPQIVHFPDHARAGDAPACLRNRDPRIGACRVDVFAKAKSSRNSACTIPTRSVDGPSAHSRDGTHLRNSRPGLLALWIEEEPERSFCFPRVSSDQELLRSPLGVGICLRKNFLIPNSTRKTKRKFGPMTDLVQYSIRPERRLRKAITAMRPA